jgi:hypothetical protein
MLEADVLSVQTHKELDNVNCDRRKLALIHNLALVRSFLPTLCGFVVPHPSFPASVMALGCAFRARRRQSAPGFLLRLCRLLLNFGHS